MSDAGQPNYRLQDLKQRWEQNPSSRLYLQLAEEYRKSGDLVAAVEVLEQGLRSRPNDLSAHVALGKTRLELENLPEAIEALQAVIAKDPAHLVANKLLLEVHLLAGDEDRAQERLDIYRLLNDRDPELEHLTFRLDQLRRGEKTEKASEPEPEPAPSEALETTPNLDLEPLRDLLKTQDKAARAEVEESSAAAEIGTPVAEESLREDVLVEAAGTAAGVVEEGTSGASLLGEISDGEGKVREEPRMGQGETKNEIFPLGDDPGPLAGGFESLWGILETRSGRAEQAPPSPFTELEPASEEEYLDALQQEGIFAERLDLRGSETATEPREVAEVSLPESAAEEAVAGPAPILDVDGDSEAEAVEVSTPEEESPVADALETSEVVEAAEEIDPEQTMTTEASEPEEPQVSGDGVDRAEGAAVAGAALAAGTALGVGLGLLKSEEPEPELAAEPEAVSVGLEPSREADSVEPEPAVIAEDEPAIELQDATPEPVAEVEPVAEIEPGPLATAGAQGSVEAPADRLAEEPEEEELDETLPMGMVATQEDVVSSPGFDEPSEPLQEEPSSEVEAPAAEVEAVTEAAEVEAVTEAAEVEAVAEEAPTVAPIFDAEPEPAPPALDEPTLEPIESPPQIEEESPVSPWAAAHAEAPEEPASEESVAAGDDEVATVTLGSLYLKQGHLEEAAKIFEKVLEQDPQNHAALSGLNLARGPEKTGLSAMDLLADRSLSGTIPAGLTAKKILVLGNYLKHLKSAVERGNVR